MKHIVITTDNYLPRWDGIARFLKELIPELARKYRITIFAPRFEGKAPQYKNTELIRFPLINMQFGDIYFAKPDKKTMKKEMKKTVVGQEEIVEGFLRGVLANGHVLVEGIPGIAKTLIVKTLATVTGSRFSRIQFTADLLPTDITGLTVYDKNKGFMVVKGPIFSNFVIADEINRSPPKTQSSLLEGMQEKQVTIGKVTYPLPIPFFVMATQNPIENRGVYNLSLIHI